MQTSPMVSVVMPSFNQAQFIEQAINSVLNQSYQKIELIVADGGSDDGTIEILKQKQFMDNRLRWFSQKDNGPAHAINNALSKVRGTIIGWLNSDDFYALESIQRAVNAFSNDLSLLMIYGQGQYVDSNNCFLNTYPTLPPSTAISKFSEGCFICQPTVFFKRPMYLLLGKLDENLKTAFDFDYWLRAFSLFQSRIGFVDEVQAYSRLHEDCITMKMRQVVILEGMQLLAKYLGSAPKEWFLTYVEEKAKSHIESKKINSDFRNDVMFTYSKASEFLSAQDCSDLKQIMDKLLTN